VFFGFTPNVFSNAKGRKLSVKFRVASLENVALREEEPWPSVAVDGAI
jgi:hypothetical protein